jgi:uncharacterized hydrophobic protein (TIGR00271 family)
MAVNDEKFLGELRFGQQLTTTIRVAANGLCLFLGLVFLIAGPAIGLVGGISSGAALLAGLALLLTLLNAFELLGGSSERGGTYILVQETVEGVWGFLTGWVIVAATLTLSAAFARSAAAHILLLFPTLPIGEGIIALIIGALLILIQVFRFRLRRERLWPALLIMLIAFLFILISSLAAYDSGNFSPSAPFSPGDMLHISAWVAMGYIAIESILATRRQVRDAAEKLPRALLLALILGIFVIALATFLGGGLSRVDAPSEVTSFATSLGLSGWLPGWVAAVVAIFATILATSSSVMACARQINVFSQQGTLPAGIRYLRSPFRLPPLLFGALFLLLIPLLLLVPTEWLTNVSAAAFLISMILLCVASIYSRQTEPDRRRPFLLPFFPLVPGIAVALNVAILSAVPVYPLLVLGLWLLLGVIFYFAYARGNQIEAQEGVLTFGPDPHRAKLEDVYRILVPLSAGRERQLMLELATALACQMNGEVVPLQVIQVADPLAIERGQRLASERNTLFQWSTRVAANSGVPTFPVTRLARSVPEGILDTAIEEQCDLILMSWVTDDGGRSGHMGHVLDPVVRRAPCDIAVVALQQDHLRQPDERTGDEATDPAQIEKSRIRRIIVPTAGGPHAPLATRLGLMLARHHNASASTVYVAEAQASEDEIQEGHQYIQQTLAKMRQQAQMLATTKEEIDALAEHPIEAQVVPADSVVQGIASAAEESDLLLIGASEESLLDQVLFGTIPEQVAQASTAPVVMVKRYRGLPRFWMQRAWDTLSQGLPNLSRQQQVTIYKEVRKNAVPSVDYFVMIGLSAIIATYGLLQDSSAVIIGAMLVAPLFTPILALSLALVQADMRLLRLAVEATLKGIALAIGIAVLLTALSPLRGVTSEIAARSQPNLFDLAVALASGAAGAYAVARKDVAASLPGVAIAAALVPPLCTIGTGMALGDLAVTQGGTLLFSTNLIAIVLAGTITLLLLGFRPAGRGVQRERLRIGIVISLALLVLISIPLAAVFVNTVQESSTRQTIQRVLTSQLHDLPDLALVEFDFDEDGDQLTVVATFYAREEVDTEIALQISEALEQTLRRPVQLRIVSIPVVEIDIGSQ